MSVGSRMSGHSSAPCLVHVRLRKRDPVCEAWRRLVPHHAPRPGFASPPASSDPFPHHPLGTKLTAASCPCGLGMLSKRQLCAQLALPLPAPELAVSSAICLARDGSELCRQRARGTAPCRDARRSCFCFSSLPFARSPLWEGWMPALELQKSWHAGGGAWRSARLAARRSAAGPGKLLWGVSGRRRRQRAPRVRLRREQGSHMGLRLLRQLAASRCSSHLAVDALGAAAPCSRCPKKSAAAWAGCRHEALRCVLQHPRGTAQILHVRANGEGDLISLETPLLMTISIIICLQIVYPRSSASSQERAIMHTHAGHPMALGQPAPPNSPWSERCCLLVWLLLLIASTYRQSQSRQI